MAKRQICTQRGARRRYRALLRDYKRRFEGGGTLGWDWRTMKLNDPDLYAELQQLAKLAAGPNAHQLRALLDFAAQNGRGWKAKLDEVWMRASGGPLLQQVRNEFGPSWLAKVTLKQLKAALEDT